MPKEIIAKPEDLRLTDENLIKFKIIAELLDCDNGGFAIPSVEFTLRMLSLEIHGKADEATGVFESQEIFIEPTIINPDDNELSVEIVAQDFESSVSKKIGIEIRDIVMKFRARIREIQQNLKLEAEIQKIEAIERKEAREQAAAAKEAERQREIERQKEVERQREIERQKEVERQEEIKRQKEIERQREAERQREMERRKEIERQEEIERKKQKGIKRQRNKIISMIPTTCSAKELEELLVLTSTFPEAKTKIEDIAKMQPLLIFKSLDKFINYPEWTEVLNLAIKSIDCTTDNAYLLARILLNYQEIFVIDSIIELLVHTRIELAALVHRSICSDPEVGKHTGVIERLENVLYSVRYEGIVKNVYEMSVQNPIITERLVELAVKYPLESLTQLNPFAIKPYSKREQCILTAFQIAASETIKLRSNGNFAHNDILNFALKQDFNNTVTFIKTTKSLNLLMLLMRFFDASIKAANSSFDKWDPEDKTIFENFIVKNRPSKASRLTNEPLKTSVYAKIRSRSLTVHTWNRIKDFL